MGKKKAFIDKSQAKRFKLIPSSSTAPVPTEGQRFRPTEEHLEEQHKFGIFYDDDYDYMQHLRDAKEGFTLQSLDDEEEERVVIKAPKRPQIPSSLFGEPSLPPPEPKETFDADIDKVLEGDFDTVAGELEDNFIELAGGTVFAGRQPMNHRARQDSGTDDDSDDDEDYDDDEFDGYENGDDEEEEEDYTVRRDGPQREIDDAFDKLLEADYNDDQVGELDGDDDQMGGFLEPDDGRLQRLAREKPNDPEYDEKLAKDYVRKRMALIEAGVIKEDETEIVEVDESCSKRMKWDCESFATQYTNIYNHPTVIKDPNTIKLSRKALKRLDRETAKQDTLEEDVEMEEDDDDDMSQCTSVSTFRPKGETPEQRRLRKQAVKEARRNRRVEKKMNKVAFAEESRKVANSLVGRIKAKPMA